MELLFKFLYEKYDVLPRVQRVSEQCFCMNVGKIIILQISYIFACCFSYYIVGRKANVEVAHCCSSLA